MKRQIQISQATGLTAGLLCLAKAVFFLVAAGVLGCVGYLVYMNPAINSLEKERKEQQARLEMERSYSRSRQWEHDETSDVAAPKETYPIVVLRTGFKAIRFEADSALVGWKYEMINTSPDNKYNAEISFKLQDYDGFVIEQGTGSAIVEPNSYGVATGTIPVESIDLDRLTDSTWSLRLTPSWQDLEKETKGKRYERLARVVRDNCLNWVHETLRNPILTSYSEKWKVIKMAVAPEERKSLAELAKSPVDPNKDP